MALNFPDAPTVNQVYTDTTSGFSFKWDGTVWQSFTPQSTKEIVILDDISGSFNDSTVTFALTESGIPFYPANAQQLRIVLGGVVQAPITDYIISLSNITFTTAPSPGLSFSGVSLGPAVPVGTAIVADGSITPIKLSTGGPSWNTSGGFYVSGITTVTNALGTVKIGTGNTTLIVEGNARTTGVITATTFSGNITGTAATFTGNVSIAGTLTYEDVTNVDSVGLVTARVGAHVATVSGNLLVGSTSATGTASQLLQVTGGAYVSGSVGIGTTNPGQALDVSGSIRASSSVSAAGASGFYSSTYVVNSRNPIWRFANADGYGLSYFQGTSGVSSGGGGDTIGFHFGTATAAASLLQLNSGIGIAVNGSVTATGNVSGYSDISLKDNIQTIPNALDKVSKLRGVEFDRNDIEGNPHQIGVIAQEVEEIIPEVVATNSDGLKSVAYGNLVGLLIEAIKDLKEEVNELKARLEEK